jgi:hypothetical protein
MNNFDLDEQAKILSDTLTPYALARRVLELEEQIHKYDEFKDKMLDDYDHLVCAIEFHGLDAYDVIKNYEESGDE